MSAAFAKTLTDERRRDQAGRRRRSPRRPRNRCPRRRTRTAGRRRPPGDRVRTRSLALRPSRARRAGRRSPGRRTHGPRAPSSHGPVRNTPTSVAPASRSRATSRSGQTKGTGALSGRKSATGCGSNVIGQRRHAGQIGLGAQPAQQPLMAEVHAVEVADRHVSASSPRGEVTNVLDRDHRHPSPLLERPAAANWPEKPLNEWSPDWRTLSLPARRDGQSCVQIVPRPAAGPGTYDKCRANWDDRATMNVLILGNGVEELAWARWLLREAKHRLDADLPRLRRSGSGRRADRARPRRRSGPRRASTS